MRTETTSRTLYQFNELSPLAQEKALDECRDPLDWGWWDFTYDTIQVLAESFGIDCEDTKKWCFDLDQQEFSAYGTIHLSRAVEAKKTGWWKAVNKEGEFCMTNGDFFFPIASKEARDVQAILACVPTIPVWFRRYLSESDCYATSGYNRGLTTSSHYDCATEKVEAFAANAADHMEDYLKRFSDLACLMLQQEADYMTSDAATRESIDANEWEFTEDGTRA